METLEKHPDHFDHADLYKDCDDREDSGCFGVEVAAGVPRGDEEGGRSRTDFVVEVYVHLVYVESYIHPLLLRQNLRRVGDLGLCLCLSPHHKRRQGFAFATPGCFLHRGIV